jgi:hypothetical protein
VPDPAALDVDGAEPEEDETTEDVTDADEEEATDTDDVGEAGEECELGVEFPAVVAPQADTAKTRMRPETEARNARSNGRFPLLLKNNTQHAPLGTKEDPLAIPRDASVRKILLKGRSIP